jgi:hypothetical protein
MINVFACSKILMQWDAWFIHFIRIENEMVEHASIDLIYFWKKLQQKS